MQKNKRLSATFFFLLCFLLLGAAPPPDPDSMYASDFAGILPQEHHDRILDSAKQLVADTGVQAVLVTITDLDGEDSTSVITDLVDDWGLGDNYFLILFSRQEDAAWVSVGSRLGQDLTAQWLQENIIDDILQPGFASGDIPRTLYEAHQSAVAAIYSALEKSSGNGIVQGAETERDFSRQQNMRTFAMLGTAVIVLRSFRVSRKARERYNKLHSKGSPGRHRRYTKTDADIEYSYLNRRREPSDDDR